MISLVCFGRRLRVNVLAVAFGIWLIRCSPTALADDGDFKTHGHRDGTVHHGHGGSAFGTLGYASYGAYPGYQGFGLKYHLGDGYGGHALGVSAFGGYPYYGGPGYPHEAPGFKTFCGVPRFPYYGGPGYSYDGHPNFFDEPGQLVVNEPVVGENADTASGGARVDRVDHPETGDYGMFTGMIPYPESLFAPYTAAAAAGVPSGGDRSVNRQTNATFIATARDFGIDEEPIVDTDGARAIKVSNVYAGTPSAKAGFQTGDVIRSINGYRTEQEGNLAWIVANATPHTELKINVRKLSDGKVQSVTVSFP